MKKRLDILGRTAIASLLLLAAVELPSCRGEEEGPATREMRFGVSGEATRATEALGEGYRLWASALYHYDSSTPSILYFSSGTGTTKEIELAYRASDNSYAATDYFFPYVGDMDLLAYGVSGSTKPTVSVTRETLAANSTFSQLILTVDNLNGAEEIICAEPLNVACASVVSPVLHFRRPQANLRFVFEAADEETCRQVRFNYIEVQGVTCKGRYRFNYKTDSGAWENAGAAQNVRVTNFAGGTIPSVNTPLTAGRGLYILPQDSRVRIIVNYTMINQAKLADTRHTYIENYGNDPVDTSERTVNYVVNQKAEDISKGWLAGHQYTYHIYVRGAEQMEVKDLHVEEVVDAPTGNLRI